VSRHYVLMFIDLVPATFATVPDSLFSICVNRSVDMRRLEALYVSSPMFQPSILRGVRGV
jgi:hypothetical protein